MDLHNLISDIEKKIKRLVLRNQRLEEENKELRTSVFNYLQQLETQKNEISLLQQDMKNKEIASLSAADKKELQREIDKYVLLIDKCISSVKVNSLV